VNSATQSPVERGRFGSGWFHRFVIRKKSRDMDFSSLQQDLA
jgi:hypothetical protein